MLTYLFCSLSKPNNPKERFAKADANIGRVSEFAKYLTKKLTAYQLLFISLHPR